MVQKLVREVQAMKREELMLMPPGADDPTRTRRIAEACVAERGMKVEVVVKGRNRKRASEDGTTGGRPTTKEEGRNQKEAKKPELQGDLEVIMVKPAQGKTSADIAKALKNQVSPTKG